MTRGILPHRRMHETIRFQHSGLQYVVGLGRAHRGAPISEIFINCGKAGSLAETLSRDSAVILSIALQSGVSLELLRRAITREPDGSASGPVGVLLDLMGSPE
jgi:ribonucleoside-diphosphate reductase alpha chain